MVVATAHAFKCSTLGMFPIFKLPSLVFGEIYLLPAAELFRLVA